MHRLLVQALCLALGACASIGAPPEESRQAMAPAGRWRVAIFAAPVFMTRGAQGEPDGWAPALTRELASRAGVPAEIRVFNDLRAFSECVPSGECDAAWMGYDARRARTAWFSQAVARIGNTFVVQAASSMRRVADVDQDGRRIAVLPGTANEASLQERLRNAQLVRDPAFGAARLQLLTSGRVDALAESRAAARAFEKASKEVRALEGVSHYTTYHLVMATDRPVASEWADATLAEIKASGWLARSLDGNAQADVEPVRE